MNKKNMVIFCVLLLFASITPIGVCSNSLNFDHTSNPKLTVNQELDLVNSYLESSEPYEGFTIFSPEYSKNSYLINNNKFIVHKWKSEYIQSFGSYLSEIGILARLDFPYDNPTFRSGGVAAELNYLIKKVTFYGNLNIQMMSIACIMI